MRTSISYGAITPLLIVTGMPQRRAWVEVDEETVRVRMAWGFSADIPRAAVLSARPLEGRVPLSIGVHGWRGRWLVNGSRSGLVVVDIDPPQTARVGGVPVSLRKLTVSVEDPDDLVDALN